MEFRDETKKNDKHQLLTHTCPNQTTSWLVCSLIAFGALMNHKQTQIHKIHHGPNLGEATTSPFIVYYVLAMGPTLKWHFVPRLPSGSPEIPKVETTTILVAHNFVCRPLIDMRFKIKL
jgi:hypothetical protein